MKPPRTPRGDPGQGRVQNADTRARSYVRERGPARRASSARVGRASQRSEGKSQRSECSEGGNQQEPEAPATAARIGNIVAEVTLLDDCGTDSTDSTDSPDTESEPPIHADVRRCHGFLSCGRWLPWSAGAQLPLFRKGGSHAAAVQGTRAAEPGRKSCHSCLNGHWDLEFGH